MKPTYEQLEVGISVLEAEIKSLKVYCYDCTGLGEIGYLGSGKVCKSCKGTGLISLQDKIDKLESRINTMSDIYKENRSDVSDMLDSILEGNEPDANNAEARFTYWTFNGVKFEYDTLTTQVSYKSKDGYKLLEVEYKY